MTQAHDPLVTSKAPIRSPQWRGMRTSLVLLILAAGLGIWGASLTLFMTITTNAWRYAGYSELTYAQVTRGEHAWPAHVWQTCGSVCLPLVLFLVGNLLLGRVKPRAGRALVIALLFAGAVYALWATVGLAWPMLAIGIDTLNWSGESYYVPPPFTSEAWAAFWLLLGSAVLQLLGVVLGARQLLGSTLNV